MFVGWIRQASLEKDLNEFEKSCVVDKNLILNSAFYNQSLCFGIYEGNLLKGLISAYCFEKTILINNFYYTQELESSLKTRLINILLKNISEEDKSILVISRGDEKSMFEGFGFKSLAPFKQVLYSGGAVFNFTNATSKAISNENFLPTLKRVDTKCFAEDRSVYITKSMFKTSSLLLSSELGYQHSYALSKNIIKLSPWIMQEDNFDDGEKLLRGVLYHRGLKKILAFVPADEEEITNLYKSYKFEFLEDYELLYKNDKPDINTKMIYGF